MNKVIKLTGHDIVGQGTNRACYVHPEDESKCIKVTISGDFSESNKEKKYYNFLKKKNISWEMLAQYYGSVDTDLGEGLVFDLVRDYDGNVSKTLQYYLLTEERLKTIINPILLLKSLKSYQLNEKIIIKDLNVKNMMYQKTSQNEARLIVIDGVLNNDFLPLANHIDFLTNKKILRRWKTFENSFVNNKIYKRNKFFLKIIEDSSFS